MCVSVCLLVTFVSPTKTVKPIEMLFFGEGGGRLTHVGARNHVLDGVEIHPQEGAVFGGSSCPFESTVSQR